MFRPIFQHNPLARWASRLVLACCLLPAATPVIAAEEKDEGIRLYQSQQYHEAAPLLKRAAIKGNAKAQAALGLMYMEGLGVTQNYRKAKKWFEKAARQGRADAQTFLGMLYSRGQGTEQDYAAAKTWFEKAAV